MLSFPSACPACGNRNPIRLWSRPVAHALRLVESGPCRGISDIGKRAVPVLDLDSSAWHSRGFGTPREHAGVSFGWFRSSHAPPLSFVDVSRMYCKGCYWSFS